MSHCTAILGLCLTIHGSGTDVQQVLLQVRVGTEANRLTVKWPPSFYRFGKGNKSAAQLPVAATLTQAQTHTASKNGGGAEGGPVYKRT